MTVIDCFPLIFLPGGIKSYLLALLKALNEEPFEADTFTLLIPQMSEKNHAFYYKEVRELEEALTSVFTIKYVRVNPLFLFFLTALRMDDSGIRRYMLFIWERFYIPRVVRSLKPTIVLHPYQAVSNYKTDSKKVVVVHDTLHWNNTNHYSPVIKYLYNTYREGCIHAHTILTISETSKKEIMDLLHINSEKIKVVYEGIDDAFLTLKATDKTNDEVRKKFALPEKYIFAFTSLRKYKNSMGIVKVFEQLQKEDPDIYLVLAGWAATQNEELNNFIQTHGFKDKVIYAPKIDLKSLFYLYGLSFVFLFPSFEEGFGLPPLEALASGTLPIVSNVSSLGEIYKDYLKTFSPEDINGMAAYIHGLTKAERNEVIKSARAQLLNKYTWKRVLPLYLKYIL